MVLARPEDRAVIVGSTQPVPDDLAARAAGAGYALVRRRSGGAAVTVCPGAVVWADFFLPARDELLLHDVRAGSYWVGELWTAALASVAPGHLAVHRGGVVATQFSPLSCFLGLGPGEVLLDGRKLVGLSQRRTRDGAWFFTLCYTVFDPAGAAELLAGPGARALTRALADGVAVLPLEVGAVEAALRAVT